MKLTALLLFGCAIGKVSAQDSTDQFIRVRTYETGQGRQSSSLYKTENNGQTRILFQCKVHTSDYACYYPDSILVKWLCDSVNMDEFIVTRYEHADSLSFGCQDYLCFFRIPYSFSKYSATHRKDTIFTDRNKILHHDSIRTDEYGYKHYLRLILDSMYIRATDTIYVIKEDELQEKENSAWSEHVNFPHHLYHVTKSGWLYYVAELCGVDFYCPTMEFIEERIIRCR